MPSPNSPSRASGTSTRRDLLKGTLAAAATGAVAMPSIVPATALGRTARASAAERVTLGVIGIGPRCTYVLKSLLKEQDLQCVAIADVQASRRDAGKKLVDEHYGNTDLKLYRDFRELLARKDIDAVLIATGDRWHATASILAAEAGKDIYCEKPCALTIELAQKVAETMKRTGRVFQAGTQRRSVANFVKAVELAHSGKLGTLQTLYASVYTPTLDNTWLPAEPTPARDVCDWDLWLGPAPWRPYNAKYVQGGWRGYYDFESGARLLDWGAHTLDLCQWANRADDTTPVEFLPEPKRIVCQYANGVTAVLDFLETPFGERPGWNTALGTCPVRFVGDAGSVETGDNGGMDLTPASLKAELKDFTAPAPNVGLEITAHARNFLDAIKTRKPTVANADVMRKSHIACHAAATAWILQRPLKFDPAQEVFVNDDEANGLRSRSPRAPWFV